MLLHRFWGFVVIAICLQACASGGAHKEEHAYVLDAVVPNAMSFPNKGPVLLVSAPEAWPGFDSPNIVYVDKAHKLGGYGKSRWADSLPRMLSPLLVSALEQTGKFAAIVKPTSAISATWRLDVDQLVLKHVLLTNPSKVQASLRVQLVDIENGRVLATRWFNGEEVSQGRQAYAGVVAANALLQRMVKDVADFCASQAEFGT